MVFLPTSHSQVQRTPRSVKNTGCASLTHMVVYQDWRYEVSIRGVEWDNVLWPCPRQMLSWMVSEQHLSYFWGGDALFLHFWPHHFWEIDFGPGKWLLHFRTVTGLHDALKSRKKGSGSSLVIICRSVGLTVREALRNLQDWGFHEAEAIHEALWTDPEDWPSRWALKYSYDQQLGFTKFWNLRMSWKLMHFWSQLDVFV